jgi:hypothetical protein
MNDGVGALVAAGRWAIVVAVDARVARTMRYLLWRRSMGVRGGATGAKAALKRSGVRRMTFASARRLQFVGWHAVMLVAPEAGAGAVGVHQAGNQDS